MTDPGRDVYLFEAPSGWEEERKALGKLKLGEITKGFADFGLKEGSSNADPNATFEKKAEDAVDFGDETEVISDDETGPAPRVATTVATAVSMIGTSNRTAAELRQERFQDEFDFDGNESDSQPAPTSVATTSTATFAQPTAPVTRPGRKEKEKPQMKITDEMFSTTHGPRGPLLMFSQIFTLPEERAQQVAVPSREVRQYAERVRQNQIQANRAILEQQEAQAAKGDANAAAQAKKTQEAIDRLEADEQPEPPDLEDEEDEVGLFEQDFSAFTIAGQNSTGGEMMAVVAPMEADVAEPRPSEHLHKGPASLFDRVGTYLIEDVDDEEVKADSPAAMDVEPTSSPLKSSASREQKEPLTLSSAKYKVQKIISPLGDDDHEYETVMHYPWEVDILWSDAKPTAAQPARRKPQLLSDDEEDETSLVGTDSSDESLPNGTTGLLKYVDDPISWNRPAVGGPRLPGVAVRKPPAPNPAAAAAAAVPLPAKGDAMDVDAASSQVKNLGPLFRPVNQHLFTDDWLEMIVWDEADAQQKRIAIHKNNKVVIELNDINMLFEDTEADLDDYLDELAPDVGQGLFDAARKKKRKQLQLPSRVLSTTELILRTRQDQQKHIDKFNLSNDTWYLTPRTQAKNRMESIQHSLFAFKYLLDKPNLTKDEVRNFHQPKLQKVALRTMIRIGVPRTKRKRGKEDKPMTAQFIKRRKDLSAVDGHFILAEMVEEFPPLLHSMGMQSRLRNYYKKDDEGVVPQLELPEGEQVILEKTDESPFLGNLKSGTVLQSLENNMYKAPIFRHAPRDTDFLLIRTAKDRWVLREIKSLYTVGQLQPLQDVMGPNSRTANIFVKHRLQQYVYYLFRRRKEEADAYNAKNPYGERMEPAVRISDISLAFPGQSDNSIRKRLQHCSEFKRGGDSGAWYLKSTFNLPTDEEIRAMLTLEEICLYDSMLAGSQRLTEVGIEHLTTASPALSSIVSGIPASNPRRRAYRLVEEELQISPWNLTLNFVNAIQGKGLLQLTGFGDPSNRGEAFSYLRMAQKLPPKEDRRDKEPKVVVTGTDRDLRKVSLEDSRRILLEYGLSEEEIATIPRWQRIGRIRVLSNKFKESGEENADFTKFARHNRHSVAAHQSQYNDKCQTIFENQIRALSDPNPPYSDEDENEGDDDDLDDLAKDLESDLLDSSKAKKLKPKKRRIEQLLHPEDEEESQAAKNDERELAQFLKKQSQEATAKDNAAASAAIAAPKPIVATTTTTTVVIPPPAGQTKEKLTFYLKKTVVKSDGTREVQLIKDPMIVKDYIAKQKQAEKTGARPTTAKRGFRAPLSEEEERKRLATKREKRRIQERNRRARKNQEKQKELQKKFNDGVTDGLAQSRGNNFGLKCKRCGMMGHMKTNRICPKWVEGIEDEEDLAEGGIRARRPSRSSNPKKRTRELDDEDELMEELNPSKRRLTMSRRSRRTFEMALSELLQPVLKTIQSNPEFALFKSQVNRRDYPDYYEVVHNPMWTDKIKDNLAMFAYSSTEQFLSDFALIRDNCYDYNVHRFPHLLDTADQLYDTAEEEIRELEPQAEDLRAEFDEMEANGTDIVPMNPLVAAAVASGEEADGGDDYSHEVDIDDD